MIFKDFELVKANQGLGGPVDCIKQHYLTLVSNTTRQHYIKLDNLAYIRVHLSAIFVSLDG